MPSAAPSPPPASRPRPPLLSTPLIAIPRRSASASRSGTGLSRSARRGVRQRSRATSSGATRPWPGGYSASTDSAERRSTGAVCRTTSGDSTLTALPATSRCPTSEISRTLVSQPSASAAHRAGRSCSRQAS
jgi:hypothetical protein